MADHSAVPVTESLLERVARTGWLWLLGLGIVAIIVGIVVLAWPHQTVRVVGVLFGIYLLISGLIELALAFTPGERVRLLGAITGALLILLGLISFRGELEKTLLLALWIGFGWLITGITRAVAAGTLSYVPYRGWQILGGIVLAIGGVVVIVSPVASLFALAVLSGILLIIIGAWQIVEAFVLRSHASDLLAATRA